MSALRVESKSAFPTGLRAVQPDAIAATINSAATTIVAIGGGDFGVNVHLAPADLVSTLDAAVVDVTTPEVPRSA